MYLREILVFLLALCCTMGLQAQKKKPVITPLIYHYENNEKDTDFLIDFPFPFQTKKETRTKATIYYISAKDTVSESVYILNYTLHHNPLGKIDPLELAKTTLETFLLASETEVIKESIIYRDDTPVIEATTSSKKAGMCYHYRVFMYGNFQVQMMVANPCENILPYSPTIFFDSLIIR